ncbi:hypothetical protein FRC18_003623 [Serendipita sp. 400]|nr:hypothetical protein FRC18_003623 [Serendipita sp. 400]
MTSLKRAKSIAPSRTASSGSTSNRRKRSKSIESFQSSNDPYLDSLLARSIAALELSNALLQSTLTTKSTLSSVLASEEELERQEKRFEERLLDDNEGRRMEWMQMMDSIVRDVESLFDGQPNPSQLENTDELSPRRMGLGLGAPPVNGSGLVRGDDTQVANRARSQPPRALTQYVVVSGANARAPTFASEATADKDSIYLPSTTGLRSTAHKEPFRNAPSSKGESSTSRRASVTSVRPGHSPMPSTSTSSSSYRPPPPPTHPEALPLSTQELLERRQAETRTAGPSSTTTREGLYEYLRGLHTHSASPSIASASSTVSKRSRPEVATRPVLSPHQPRVSRSKDKLRPFPPSPTSSVFSPRFAPQIDQDDNRHTRVGSTASASTLSSTTSSPQKSSSSPSFQLPIAFPSSLFRRSPSLRSPTPLSPTDSNASFNSETAAPFDWYSPSLAAIPDQHEDGEFGLDRQATIVLSGSAPSESVLGHVQPRGRSPRISPGLAPGQGRAILRGRFKTADTLRKILDTSPSPHPLSSSLVSQTSTIDDISTVNFPGAGDNNSNSRASRSNTDTSNRTIKIRKSSSRGMSRDNTLPASIPYDVGRGGGSGILANITDARNIHAASSSSISSSVSLPHSIHSPSNFSSTSDLPSTASDLDRRKSNALTLRRPAPRFMPRTPSGMTAGISVSGATARAPKMRAHLVEEMEIPDNVIPPSSSSPGMGVGVDMFGETHPVVGGGGGGSSSTAIAQTKRVGVVPPPLPLPLPLPPLDDASSSSSERRRTKSLTVSVSSMLGQARNVEDGKAAATAAATGRRTSGSKLKGSPAWHAERKLAIERPPLSSPPLASSASSINGGAAVVVEAGGVGISSPGSSNPGSKRTSWIGVPVGLLGLAGLTPAAGATGATASSNSSIHNGTSTPPMRVSFAKEPVRYSVERDSMSFEEEEEDDNEEEEEGAAAEEEMDGGMTIRPTDGSALRRSQSWDGSIRENTLTASAKGKGKGKATRPNGLRRVPSRSHSKKKNGGDGEEGGAAGKNKKDGWLEWFVGAMTAGPNGSVAGPFSSGTGGLIGREELFENRGRDDW